MANAAFDAVLGIFSKRTLVILVAFLVWALGAMSSQVAEAWWITTHRPDYMADEIARRAATEEAVRTLRRDVDGLLSDRQAVQDVRSDLGVIKGQLSILLRRVDWR